MRRRKPADPNPKIKIHNNQNGQLNVQIPNNKKFSGDRKDEFHSVRQKLLHVTKRARPDIGTVVAYLCTRVSKSTEGDWGKLIRCVKFLKFTINDKRIMGMDDSGILRTWIDASYSLHPDMRGQSGGMISLGHGSVSQKLMNRYGRSVPLQHLAK